MARQWSGAGGQPSASGRGARAAPGPSPRLLPTRHPPAPDTRTESTNMNSNRNKNTDRSEFKNRTEQNGKEVLLHDARRMNGRGRQFLLNSLIELSFLNSSLDSSHRHRTSVVTRSRTHQIRRPPLSSCRGRRSRTARRRAAPGRVEVEKNLSSNGPGNNRRS